MELMTHASTFLLPQPPSAADGGGRPAYALIILNQALPRFAPLLWNHAQLRVCADGGANRVYDEMPRFFPGQDALDVRKRYKPDVIKGDMDSIRSEVQEFYSSMKSCEPLNRSLDTLVPRIQEGSRTLYLCSDESKALSLESKVTTPLNLGKGTDVVDESSDQDTTDLHKCISFIQDCMPILDKPNLHILVTGALGGRFDHEVGNINVLYLFSGIRIILLSDDCLIQLLPKSHQHEIHIQSSVEGPYCGLVPVGAPSACTTTTGLQWDLTNSEMKFGGLISTSNVVREERITVHSDADLVWTISLRNRM